MGTAEYIHDRHILLKQQRSQTDEGPSEPCEVDETQLYLEVVRGDRKHQIYGLGSQAFSFYTRSNSSSFNATFRAEHEALQEEVHRLRATLSSQQTQIAQYTQF